jgi:hypothetical protein
VIASIAFSSVHAAVAFALARVAVEVWDSSSAQGRIDYAGPIRFRGPSNPPHRLWAISDESDGFLGHLPIRRGPFRVPDEFGSCQGSFCLCNLDRLADPTRPPPHCDPTQNVDGISRLNRAGLTMSRDVTHVTQYTQVHMCCVCFQCHGMSHNSILSGST